MRIPILNKLMDGPEKRAVDRAARLLEQGKAEQAAAVLRSALARSPRSPVLLLEAARVAAAAGHRDEAAGHLRSLIRTGGDARDRVRELAEMGRLQGLEVGHVHDVLAEHALREGRFAAAQEHLEKIPGEERARYAEAQRKRFEAGLRGPQERPARAALASGLYVALAHEASAADVAALQVYRRLLEAEPDLYGKIADRLQSLSSRNYREASVRLDVLDLHLAHGDGAQAGADAGMLLEAAPGLAAALVERLRPALERHPEEPVLRLALSRACWADGDGEAAADLLAPLTDDDGLIPQLTELLARWRVERPEAGRIALLQAELLGRAGKGSQAVQAILEVADGLAPAEAGPALERILARSPKEARAWRMLAEVRRADGDLDGAVEAIDRLAREVPERADEGAEVLRAVLAGDPSHGPAHRLLAGMLLGRGEVDAAVTLLRHRLLLDPGDAAQLAGELESLGGQHPAVTSIELGAAEAWMAAGQPAQAIAHLASAASAGSAFAAQVAHRLSQVVRRDPSLAVDVEPVIGMLEGAMADPAAIPFLRAEVAAAAGDAEAAAAQASECYGLGGRRAVRPVAALLEGLVRRHPGAPGPRMMLANLLADHGQVARAVAVVAEGRDPDPGAVSALLRKVESLPEERRDPGTRCAVARLLLFAGRPEEALATADAVLRDAGDRTPADLHLVRAAALLARREPEAAIASVRQACRRDPALLPRGIEILEARLDAEPEDALTCRAVGGLRLAAGQVLEGLSLLLDLADGHPEHREGVLGEIEALGDRFRDDPRLPLTAARLQALAGRPDQAWETLGEAREAGATAGQIEELTREWLERAPGDPGVLLLVARCRAAGDPVGASELLERVASRDPARIEEAVELLEGIAGAHPETPEPRCAAGRIRLAQGDPARAFAVARPAFRVPTDDAAATLLRHIRIAWPDAEEPARAMARLLLSAGRPGEALPEVEAARSAGAAPEELLPLLDDLVQAARSPAALLTRSAVRAETGDLEGAVADLDTALADGADAAVRGAVETILEARPDHLPARRLHLRLLRNAGDADAVRQSLELGLEHATGPADRCELLLERSDLLRASGRAHEAARDLQQAEELAEDRGAFLARVHRRYLRRLRERMPQVPVPERVRMLLDLGRLEEAAGALDEGGMDAGAARALRADLLLARGETASGLLLLRSQRPTAALVDGAQRCDQTGLALAAVERLLESGGDPGLHRARSRLVRDLWRREVGDRSAALVGRVPFVPRGEEAG